MAYASISKPKDYFNTVLITGNATDPRSVTGYGFAPDLIFGKMRSGNANGGFFDKVRGATKFLYSNQTDAEGTTANTLTSFDSDGFTIGDDNSNFYYNGSSFVYWGWRAGGTSGSSNSDGSITSTVSANTTAGFSIVSYTSNGSASQTVGHGLGVAPNVIISKNRTNGTSTYGNWIVYFSSLPTANDKKLLLNSSSASSTTNEWGDTDPTSSVYSVHTGGDGATNHSTDNIIAYCFAEKKGYSKFGSYTGNSSTDGTFVYTGFKPAFLIIKKYSDTSNWMIYDDKREGYNVDNDHLKVNQVDQEGVSDDLDLLSNGFKLRTSGSGENSGNFIYMAFAAEPLVANVGASIPATAR